MSGNIKLMKRNKETAIRSISLGAALFCLVMMVASCGQGAAPSDTGVYSTEPYDIPWGLALNKDETAVYAANNLRDNISVYDVSTMKVLYKISTMCKPLYMTFNTDYSLLYVSHDIQSNCLKSQTTFSVLNGAYISVIDVAAKKVIKEISVSAVSKAIRNLVYDGNHNVLYAVAPEAGKIAIIDAGSGSVANTLSFTVSSFKPMRVKYDEVNNKLYIVDAANGYIDISIPVDPQNLEFKKIGYDMYQDGYCLGTKQRGGCSCKEDAGCRSGTCDVEKTLPYCSSVECEAESYKGAAGSEKSCSSTTTTTTTCKKNTENGACTGTFSSGVCVYKDIVSLAANCTKNSDCTSVLGSEYACNTDSGDCEKSIYDDNLCSSSAGCAAWKQTGGPTVACTSQDESTVCKTSDYTGSVSARCNADNNNCEWFVKYSTSAECVSAGLLSCNTDTGTCDLSYINDAFCDSSEGYSCSSTTGMCTKTTYDENLCDASLEQKCDSSTGFCYSTTYKDSLCDMDGYKCDRGDGICKISRYQNGCPCIYDTECIGNEKSTDFCSDAGVCNTYSKIKVTSIEGYCDMRYNDCYSQTVAQTYNDRASQIGATPCSSPSDILVLSDKTAYIACYGAASGTNHQNDDPLLRILLNDQSVAHDSKVLVTFDSVKLCDKPFKLAKDKNEKTALVLCTGDSRVYALDIDSGETIKYFDVPKNSTDLVVSSDSFFVSGATSDKITKYPIPTL